MKQFLIKKSFIIGTFRFIYNIYLLLNKKKKKKIINSNKKINLLFIILFIILIGIDFSEIKIKYY